MPTGFSSGGGSSHSSGGGSFGGGGFHGGYHPRGFYGPGVIIINNRPYRMGKAGIGYFVCMLFMIIFIFVAFGGGVMMANSSNTKKRIEYDFIKYQDMIEFVQNNPSARDRIVDGSIKSIEPGYGKFRIIYEFYYKTQTISGYSFYVYSKDDIEELDYYAGKGIKVVLDISRIIAYGPDSIPLDFEEFDVEDDGEYVKAGFNFKVGVGMLVGGIVGTFGLIILGNVIFKKYAKPVEENANNSNNNKDNGNNNDNNNDNNNGGGKNDGNNTTSGQDDDLTYCSYCGARIKRSDRKCPNCGAKN